jgi:hypothetical protein
VQTHSTVYRLRNWKEYNASLIARGSLTLWFEEDLEDWWLQQEKTGKPGASRTFSEKAIRACLSLRLLLRLPLRQTQGFVASLFGLTQQALPVPDYTTLSRRQRGLQVRLPVCSSERPRHIVLDSTGLKVFGEGEWKVKKHGSGKRRVWRKLHLSVDAASGEVLAVVMTAGDAADGPHLPALVQESQQVGGPIGQASADGAYDSWDNDAFLTEQGIVSTIPPRAGSKIRQHGNSKKAPLQRDESLRQIRRLGRRGWARVSGYSRRSLAETQMMRQKRILGGSLLSRGTASQWVECQLRCVLLNRLTHLGMPQSYAQVKEQAGAT